jgi:hypothetical protein
MMGYYLADGIYLPCATFVKTIQHPQSNKISHFARMQESTRKDVERALVCLRRTSALFMPLLGIGNQRFYDK